MKHLISLLILLCTALTATAQTPQKLFEKANEYYASQNYPKAVELFTKAAKQGHVKAQYNLGVCYENGEGVTRNREEAVKWYIKAAEQGYLNAAAALKELGVTN